MGLDKYEEKRNFTKTAEPKAGKSRDSSKLIFVVQKHDASRLHYDFRLEMDGVLKSWAVPKGPSLDPKNKRLAMMVEDHPFDYSNFEGIIPQGEYGGGTVMVWDQGWYETEEPQKGKKLQEKTLLAQLKEGSLKIRLHGEKLNGAFALVRTKGMGENAWLLIKHDDDFTSKKDVTKLGTSVASGRDLKEIEESADSVWKDGGEKQADSKAKGAKSVVKKKKPSVKNNKTANAPVHLSTSQIIKSAPKAAMPKNIKPMLATLVNEPFDNDEWQYEVKWDGYRALASIKDGEVSLISRNNKSFNDRFYPIYQLLKKWKLNAVIDGEIIVMDKKGISNFGHLQNWRSEADGELVFYVFDILWYGGKDLMHLSLVERQAILKEILPAEDDRIRISKAVASSGTAFYAAAARSGLEGIMAKRKASAYNLDKRTKDWLKIKVSRRQEVIIAGFTRNENTKKVFSSLILAVHDKGELSYVGKVGTGFSNAQQKELMEIFEPYISKESPFKVTPNLNKPSRFQHNNLNAKATWLKPELVCEIAFTEITADGVFRHPSFEAMRSDKNAKDVVRESAIATDEIVDSKSKKQDKKEEVQDIVAALVSPPTESTPKTLLNPKDQTQVRKVDGKELKFTNLSKLYWPNEGVSKRDLFNYYYCMAEYILPYLKDRPLSLNRYPGGINGPSFFQKDVKGKAPSWAKTFPYQTSDGEDKEYLVGKDTATLMWMVSLGAIEINPWFSRIQHPERPDYCVIDLDPDQQDFDQVIEVALVVKSVLDKISVVSFVKTSGATGMHIYIPLGGKYEYDESQGFARKIVEIVHHHLPELTSLERMIAARKGKMYLDFLQNRPGATIAGPYSVRPKAGASVSMPLAWEELKPGLKVRDFNIFNALDRLKEKGDIFKEVLGKGIDLTKAMKKAEELSLKT